MKYVIAIDDTDMPGTTGTGWLVQELCEKMEIEQMGTSSAISRHQLFVHEDVPYTSHNSSMCFEFNLASHFSINSVRDFIIQFLEQRAEKGSDPGLCILAPENLAAHAHLIDFGRKAKCQVLNKNLAYQLAKEQGVYLSEHGGTGDGIIGALAGVGLRIAGDDGRYRGWYHLGPAGKKVCVKDLQAQLPFVDQVVTSHNKVLLPETSLCISTEKIKTIRKNGLQVILAMPNDIFVDEPDIQYRIMAKEEAKNH